MQILIVGCGNVGLTLIDQLSKEGHNITVIEEKSDVIQNVVNNYDVMGIVGNGASYSIMKDAGIESADLMIAVTNSDELNILSCLFAKKAGNCSTIARVRNPIYKKEVDFIRDELGLSLIINPEEAAAMEASRLLKFPSATKIEQFVKGRTELVKITVNEDSRLCNKTLKEIQAEIKSNVLISVVARGEEVFIPDGSFVLRANDEISVIGTSKDTLQFFKKLKMPTARVNSTLIVGGGATAYYLAKSLIEAGIQVKIFEKDNARCKQLTELIPEALIINADGTDKEMLFEEGLTRMESFVSLTNLDEENIMLSMFVKSVAPKAKLITKVHRVNYDEIIGSMGIGSVIYPKYITAERIVSYVRGMSNSRGSNIESLYKMNDDRVEVLEFNVRKDSPVIGIPLQNLDIKKGVIIARINRGFESIAPGGQSMIRGGDTVIVVTTNTGFHDIEDILQK